MTAHERGHRPHHNRKGEQQQREAQGSDDHGLVVVPGYFLGNLDWVSSDHLHPAGSIGLENKQVLTANLAELHVADRSKALWLSAEIFNAVNLNGAVAGVGHRRLRENKPERSHNGGLSAPAGKIPSR